ncbi:MAG: PQQ-dependent sugar dehydrogenase [Gemmatimonadaceae bacterium]|nr:PQQ-dependent sugar dehydrogenase [Gemmatimonadaceae bacterium]
MRRRDATQGFRPSMVLVAAATIACGGGDKAPNASVDSLTSAASVPACPGDNGGLTLPPGFCATIFADSLGHARHIVVSSSGDVYLNTWSGRYYPKAPPPAGGFLVALRDTNSDGRADRVERFGDTPATKGTGGTGIVVHNGMLFAEAGDKIVRYALDANALASTAGPVTVVGGLPLDGDHPMHPFTIDSSGALYVSSGSESNSCQIKERTSESKGKTPCAELVTRAGIWRYDANKTDQRFSSAERFATGIRNAVGLTIGPDGALYATQHGRDQLAENWPKLYTPEQGQELPAEQVMRVQQGDDYGWPMCYYDGRQQKLVLAPEYGGDGGKAVGDCAARKAPVATFPAHWAPNDMLFYSKTNFPARYQGGVFVAFHGSWNRTPGPQGGYQVVFLPFADGKPLGAHETFANGFAGAVVQPDRADHRPSGVAVGPDGALYVTDDVKGRVWRITYRGVIGK